MIFTSSSGLFPVSQSLATTLWTGPPQKSMMLFIRSIFSNMSRGMLSWM